MQSALYNSIPFVYVEGGVGEAISLLVSTHYLHILAFGSDNPGNIARFNLWKSSSFILFDTFAGVDVKILDPLEAAKKFRTSAYGGSTVDVISERLQNVGLCAPNLRIIQGSMPSTLSISPKIAESYSFLHVDMNNLVPEVGMLNYYLPHLSPGSVILLDDYGFNGFELQRNAINNLTDTMGLPRPISLPTGQAMIFG